MSLTLELPPDLDAQIRRVAQAQGVPVESCAIAALRQQFQGTLQPAVRPTEAELLERIRQNLPTDTLARYRALTLRSSQGELTEDERLELLPLIDEVELWNARRLELVAELARLRGVSLRRMVEELGLVPGRDA
jgi:hypothetical protein